MSDRVQIGLRLDRELRERIDQARGGTPREAWIRESCEIRLSNRGPIGEPRPEYAQSENDT